MMRLTPDVFQIETHCRTPESLFSPNHLFPRLIKIHLFQIGTWTLPLYPSIIMQLPGSNINFLFYFNTLGEKIVLLDFTGISSEYFS